MPNIDQHAPGTFCWTELATTDAESAKKFYSGLFGWTPEDTPIGPGGFYTLFKLEGRNVGGMYVQMKDQREQGIPPNWMLYVASDNADSTVAQAKAIGFTVYAGPFDVMDKGRMAIVADPQGATFGVWQAMAQTGSGLVNVPGTFCWGELVTLDVPAAAELYGKLFGWKYKVSPDYTEIENAGTQIGGMSKISSEGGAFPHWAGYLMVANCDESSEKVKSLGGKLYLSPMDIPNTGRVSVVADPQGASFLLFQPLAR